MCAAYGQQGHPIQERTVLVGYACERHSQYQQQQESSSRDGYSDSGYGTASHGSHRHSSRRSRRWNILSSVTGYASWQIFPLACFEFDDWRHYLFSFRRRTSSAPPSELTLLLVGHDRLMASSAPWRSAPPLLKSNPHRTQPHISRDTNQRTSEGTDETKRYAQMPWFSRSYRRRKEGIHKGAQAQTQYNIHEWLSDLDTLHWKFALHSGFSIA